MTMQLGIQALPAKAQYLRGRGAIVFSDFVHGQHLEFRPGAHDVTPASAGEVETTVRRHDGTGPTYLKIGGRVAYRLSDIEAYEASRQRNVIVPASQAAGAPR